MMYLALLLSPLLIVTGLVMMIFRSTRTVGKGLLTGGVAALGVIVLLVVGLAAVMTGLPWWATLSALVLTGAVIALLICIIWRVIKKKEVWWLLLIGMLLCVAALFGSIAYSVWKNSIPTVGESGDLLWQYRPYSEGTKVAELNEPSELTLENDLPRMDGATALYPIYSAFAKAVYPEEVLRSDSSWDVLECSTTTRAYERIVDGESDIIFCAAPSEQQLKYAEENGVELVFTPIGREAFVFFVNSKNPLSDISYDQIRGIYSGKLTQWEQLGVNGLGRIRAFQRDEGSGSQSALERLMAGETLMTPIKEDVVDGMGGIITRTADYRNYKNAIGYSFRFYSTEMAANDQIKLLSINGVAPTLENIDNGTYPIASEFFAVTRSDADENTLRLLEWMQGEQGQSLVEATGYTPIG